MTWPTDHLFLSILLFPQLICTNHSSGSRTDSAAGPALLWSTDRSGHHSTSGRLPYWKPQWGEILTFFHYYLLVACAVYDDSFLFLDCFTVPERNTPASQARQCRLTTAKTQAPVCSQSSPSPAKVGLDSPSHPQVNTDHGFCLSTDGGCFFWLRGQSVKSWGLLSGNRNDNSAFASKTVFIPTDRNCTGASRGSSSVPASSCPPASCNSRNTTDTAYYRPPEQPLSGITLPLAGAEHLSF